MMFSLTSPKAMEPFNPGPKPQKPQAQINLAFLCYVYQVVYHSDEKMIVLVSFDYQWMDQ